MATSIPTLAAAIVTAIGQSGPPTAQVLGFATGILNELTQSGTATFDSGTPGPHTISGMTGASMASRVKNAAGYPSVSTELLSFCTAVATYIQSSGQVFYTGPPPPAVPDYFLGGTISGLVGSALASAIKSAVGYPNVSTQLLGMATAITDHINNNASVISGVIS